MHRELDQVPTLVGTAAMVQDLDLLTDRMLLQKALVLGLIVVVAGLVDCRMVMAQESFVGRMVDQVGFVEWGTDMGTVAEWDIEVGTVAEWDIEKRTVAEWDIAVGRNSVDSGMCMVQDPGMHSHLAVSTVIHLTPEYV